MSDGLVELIDGAIRNFESPEVFNPWNQSDPLDCDQEMAPLYRRLRLHHHFDCSPDLILIGEAPGYQGCHFSGIAFTNESLIVREQIPRVLSRYGPRLTTRAAPWSEPSATVVWQTLYRLGIAESTVMWNAFAWHPHKQGDTMTNRAPTQSELIKGAPILRAVLDHFSGAKVIAVGNIAEATLKKLGISISAKVRHPSMGGATQFRAQMAALCGKVNP
jgi:uracil-DNA glycosylase